MTGPRPRRRASPRRSTRGRRPWRFALALLLGAVGLLPAGVEGQGAGATPPPARGMTLVLPPLDDGLQTGLDALVAEEPYRSLVRQGRLSIALVDLSDPGRMRYAAIDEDRMRYAASLPKIAIMLGVFDQIERGNLEYTPELRDRLERMIRRSENRVSSELIELVGFESIEAALRDPRHQLYEARRGGLWVGKGYGGLGVWKRDPKANLSHGATARQVARFLVMLQQRRLVSEWASTEMKSIMGEPEIHHKFVLGLEQARPRSRVYRKSGTWREWHADAAIVERDGRRYVAVGLLETRQRGVLARLIVRLDGLIFGTRPTPRAE